MAITLKQIAMGTVTTGSFLATTPVAANKVQVVKSIRLVNTSTTTASTITLSAGPSTAILVGPQNLSLGPNQLYVDEIEIVLKTNDYVNVAVAGGGPVNCVISGFERDLS